MRVVHGVEGHHALDVRRHEIEHVGHFADRRLGDPAAYLLHHPERGQKARLLGRVEREQLLEPCAGLADEHRLVRNRSRAMGAGCSVIAHRSTSPMTMSMLALMAMT